MTKLSIFVLLGLISVASTSFATDRKPNQIASAGDIKIFHAGSTVLTVNANGSATIQGACHSVNIPSFNFDGIQVDATSRGGPLPSVSGEEKVKISAKFTHRGLTVTEYDLGEAPDREHFLPGAYKGPSIHCE